MFLGKEQKLDLPTSSQRKFNKVTPYTYRREDVQIVNG